MPCYSIQTTTVKLELNADNRDFLIEAMKSLNYRVNVLSNAVYFSDGNYEGTFSDGKLTITSNSRYQTADQFDINPLKRAYSVQVIQAAAQQHGWQLNAEGSIHIHC